MTNETPAQAMVDAVAAAPHVAALALLDALRGAELDVQRFDIRDSRDHLERVLRRAAKFRSALGLPEPVAPPGAPLRYSVEYRWGGSSGGTSFATWPEAQAWLRQHGRRMGFAGSFDIPAPVNHIIFQSDRRAALSVRPQWTSHDREPLALLVQIIDDA